MSRERSINIPSPNFSFLNGKYRISRMDEHNYVIEERRVAKNPDGSEAKEATYKVFGYYGSLQGCLNGLVNNEFILPGERHTIDSLLQRIKDLEDEIKKVLKNV